MVLKLIVPRRKLADEEQEKWGGDFQAVMWGVKKYSAMVASIPVIIGLTPKWVDVIVQDENLETINFDEKIDLVGITANTSIVERAYEISDEFKKRGVKVVLGGIHPSLMPDEGLTHADCVVIGEAEPVWVQLLEDARNGQLKKIYKCDEKPDLEGFPSPSYNSIDTRKYIFYNLQTTRGCPNDCDFCSVHTFLGRKYRWKSVEKVVNEINQLMTMEKKLIFLIDDNFAADVRHTKELLKALIPMHITYTTQARLEISEDDELLSLLAASGCLSIVIGLETINQDNIDRMKKRYKVDQYFKAIEKIQSKGLLVLGSFMLGLDNDTIDVFEDTVKFIKDSKIGNFFATIVTPLPGTELFNRIESEGRLLHKNWSKYDTTHVCFKPKHMSPQDLLNGYHWVNQQLFEFNALFDRVMGLYRQWNANHARMNERLFPMMTGLGSHFAAFSMPLAAHPRKGFEND